MVRETREADPAAEHVARRPEARVPLSTLARHEHAGLLRLQRAAGNRAVATFIQRQPHDPPKPPPAVPIEESGTTLIHPADRQALLTATTGFIPLAFTAFSNASMAHAAAIKAEAKAKAEMYAMVIDVATGFLAPVFANYVVSKLAAKATQAAVKDVTKDAVVKLISKQDAFKAAFTGATKIGNQLMKTEANSLFGESEIDHFAVMLRTTFQHGAGAVLNNLTTMTDEQLIAVWTAYDPQNADENAYREVLAGLFEHYQKQVETIGEEATTETSRATQTICEVQLASKKRLANIVRWAGSDNSLYAWVTPDMEAFARAKATALGLGVPTIALKDMQLSLAEILEPAHPEWRRKDMLDIARALGPGERQRAATDPDAITVIMNATEMDGRVPGQYDRHKVLFVLNGYSKYAIDILDELDSWFTSGSSINEDLEKIDSAELRMLAQDQWFVGRIKANLSGRTLERALFKLGLGPAPPPPEPEYVREPVGHGRF